MGKTACELAAVMGTAEMKAAMKDFVDSGASPASNVAVAEVLLDITHIRMESIITLFHAQSDVKVVVEVQSYKCIYLFTTQ